MKKKFYLIVVPVAVMIISSGIYAYTYTTTVGTIGISEPTGDIATVNATTTQPDWEDVLDTVLDTENLLPNGSGNTTELNPRPNTGEENWEDVDDPVGSPDEDTTRVQRNLNTWSKDTYATANYTQGLGIINGVTVYTRCRERFTDTDGRAKAVIRTYATDYEGSENFLTTSYQDSSYAWTTNPNTGQAWTWAEIDAMEIGVTVRRDGTTGNVRCTQVYAAVDYEYLPLTGNVPTGDLFEVTEHPDYSSDLQVSVYLTNTESLQKAYDYLDMELYLEDSEEADESPNYQLLTLDNGMATFTLKDPVSDNHVLSVNGGNYGLVSDNISNWEAGWTVTPELYCEVIQR